MIDKTRRDGFAETVHAAVEAVIAGSPPPVEEAQLADSSLATLAVPESLAKGARVTLESL